jgi:TonB family protein
MASRKRFWFVTISVAAHLGTAAAVFVAGTWNIDRLDRETRPVAVLTMNLPAPAPAGGGMTLPDVKLTPKPRRLATDLHQLTTKPDPQAKPTTGNPGETIGTGTGTDPEGIGTCTTPPCGESPIPDPQPKPEPKPEPKPPVEETVIVTPNVLKMQREAGETQIQAPPAVKVAMRGDGIDQVTGVVYVCVSETGSITSVQLKKSTKYPAYDERLIQAARAWRFKPYAAKGRNVKICGTTTFVYSMK